MITAREVYGATGCRATSALTCLRQKSQPAMRSAARKKTSAQLDIGSAVDHLVDENAQLRTNLGWRAQVTIGEEQVLNSSFSLAFRVLVKHEG